MIAEVSINSMLINIRKLSSVNPFCFTGRGGTTAALLMATSSEVWPINPPSASSNPMPDPNSSDPNIESSESEFASDIVALLDGSLHKLADGFENR